MCLGSHQVNGVGVGTFCSISTTPVQNEKAAEVTAASLLICLVCSRLRVRSVIRTAIRFLPVLLAGSASPSARHCAERCSWSPACSFVVVFRKARNKLLNELADTSSGHPYRRVLQVFPGLRRLRSSVTA